MQIPLHLHWGTFSAMEREMAEFMVDQETEKTGEKDS